MDKLEQLKQVVKEKGTIKFNYNNDGCSCVIGHMANIVGIIIPVKLNNQTINMHHDGMDKISAELQEQFGISEKQLDILQLANDKYNEDVLLDYIIALQIHRDVEDKRPAVVAKAVAKAIKGTLVKGTVGILGEDNEHYWVIKNDIVFDTFILYGYRKVKEVLIR